MSALSFQKALATIIRYPNLSPQDIIQDFETDLSSEEIVRLRASAQDPLVTKYSGKMRYVRHREAMSVLRFSQQVIPSKVLDAIYYNEFEPLRKTTDSLWLGVEFLEFILARPELLARVQESSPEWAVDCLRYESAKAYVSRQVTSDQKYANGSRLRYQEFRLLNLSYDIPAFETQFVQEGELPPAAEPKDLKLLFIPSDYSPFYRMFEVDANLIEYLEIQRDKPEFWQAPNPAFYDDLQGIGLVH